MTKKIAVLILVSGLLGTRAQADLVDLNILYFSDSFSTATNSSNSRVAWDIGVGFDIGKSKALFAGINYGSSTFSDSGASSPSLAIADMGFKVSYFFNRARTWSTILAYNIKSTATYNDGASEAELRGTSIKADFGHHFMISEYYNLAVKIFYYNPSFVESVANNTVTSVSYSRTLIYPGVGFSYLF